MSREQVEAYDSAKRQEATAAGKPVRRRNTPGTYSASLSVEHGSGMVPVAMFAMIGARMKELRPRDRDATGAPSHGKPANMQRLAERFLPLSEPELNDKGETVGYTETAVGVCVITDSRTTANRLVNAARRHGHHELANGLTFSLDLAMSTRVVVLTEALARCWYLPEDFDPDSLADWSEAFGMGRDITDDTMSRLAARAYAYASEKPDLRLLFQRNGEGVAENDLPKTEKMALRSIPYASTKARATGASIFNQQGRLHGIAATIETSDPMLHERNVALGSAFWVRHVEGSTYQVEEGVLNVKVGKEVSLIYSEGSLRNPWKAVSGSLVTAVGVGDDGALTITFMHERVRRALGERALVMEAPFLPSPQARNRASIWMDAAVPEGTEPWKRTSRKVPPTVAMAGLMGGGAN